MTLLRPGEPSAAPRLRPPTAPAARAAAAAPAAGVVEAAPTTHEVFESFPWPSLVCDALGSVVLANRIAEESLGARVGAAISTLFQCDVDLGPLVARAVEGIESTATVVTAAGWTGQLHLNPLRRVAGQWAVLSVRPSGEDLRRDTALRVQEDRFQTLCEHAPAGIMCAETGMRVDYVNDRCAAVFGMAAEDLWGFGWLDGLDGQDVVEAAVGAVERAVGGDTVGPVPLTVRRPDGSLRHIEVRFAPNGTSSGGFVATVEDVTDARSLADQLERQARYDELTGLGNRRVMVDAINAAVADIVERGAEPAALVFIDLDNFKYVNDTLGHTAGDQLLAEVGRRLLDSVRDVDVVTRFGGDEFVVLLAACETASFSDIAERLVGAVGAPYDLDGRTAVVTASAGIVLVDGSASAEQVLRNADVAMYQAKRAGKNRAEVFSPEALAAAEAHMTVLTRLRDTLEKQPDRFYVEYQPICDLDGAVVGVEALARWRDDELGQVAPDVFIAAAEMSGYASKIGELIRGTAISDAATWLSAGWDGYLSVNVSAEELNDEGLGHRLMNQLVSAGLPPKKLRVELTETSVMVDPEAARRILDSLAALGVSIAIDDFGTGHSSLAYLKRFPVSVLKMDREFVDGVGTGGEDRAICEAIVALAGALGMDVIAEGVETSEQLEALRELGVPAAQGWLFSKPVPATEIPAVLGLGASEPY